MVKKKAMVSKLANQLSYAAYQKIAPHGNTAGYYYPSHSARIPQVGACTNDMSGYFHKMCNKLSGAMPRTPTRPEPETPSKKLMRLRRYLMRQRQPMGAMVNAEKGEKVMNTVNYAQYNNNMWKRPVNTMGMPGCALAQHMLGANKQVSSTNIHREQTSGKPFLVKDDYRPFNFGMCANKCLDIDEEADSEVPYAIARQHHPYHQQQVQTQRQQFQTESTLQKSHFQVNSNFNPVSILKKRQTSGGIGAGEPQITQDLNDFRHTAKQEYLKTYVKCNDNRYPEKSNLDTYGRMYSNLTEADLTKRTNNLKKQSRSQKDNYVPEYELRDEGSYEQVMRGPAATDDSEYEEEMMNEVENEPQVSRSALYKENHNLVESDAYEAPKRYIRTTSTPKKCSFSKNENDRILRKRSCSELTKSESEADEECVHRSRSKYKTDAKPRSRSCQSRLSAGATDPETSSSNSKHKNDDINLEALGKLLRTHSVNGDPERKQRKLNLSQLLKDNKLSDIKSHQLWDSLMQLVVQMCASDVAEKVTKSKSTRGRSSSRNCGDDKGQKQYSIYLLVTSDEESEGNQSSDGTLRNKKVKSMKSRSRVCKTSSVTEYENQCGARYTSEHASNPIRSPFKSTVMRAQRSKSINRAKGMSRTEKIAQPELEVYPALRARPPLHWPKRDYSKGQSKSSQSKSANRTASYYPSTSGKSKRSRRSAGNGATGKPQMSSFSQRYWRDNERPVWSTVPVSNTMNSKSYSRMFTYPLTVSPENYGRMMHSNSRH